MSITLPIDLSRLPAPSIIEPLDYEAIFSERKAALIALFPQEQQAELAATLALESEPLTILLQESAYRELLLRQRINDAARGVMLAYAQGSDLDQLAALLGIKRLSIQAENKETVPPTDAIWESDSALRERTQGALEGFSTAGPRGAYVMHARSADGRVADASAISPSPATVIVTILTNEGGGTASDDVLETVARVLNDETMRPIGDRLTVQSAVIVPYTVEATLILAPGPEAEPILAVAQARLTHYVNQQRRLGRDIRRSAIFAALHVEGVQQVELIAPADDMIIPATHAAFCIQANLQTGQQDG